MARENVQIVHDELLDADMVQLLELAVLQQKFAEPDDELTDVIQRCSQPGNRVANIATSDGQPASESRRSTTIMAVHQLPRGTVLDGRYAVGEVLGQGGFGITYAAQDLVLNTRVAIKEYYPTGYVNRDASHSYEVVLVNDKERDFVEKGRERFLEEARALARFQNLPGVVNVQSYFEQNNTAYIVMEYLEGTDLRRYLAENLPFDADDIFARMEPVMDALEQIHAAGMLHRDISPDNIMLLDDGNLKLMDFGAARLIDYEAPRTVSIVLKPGFTPEEQYLPKGKLGPWTDIYALCATLYRCITGATPEEALQRAYEDEIEWPSELGFRIRPEQEAVLRKGMATRPENRFQTVAQMRRVLNGEDSAEEALVQLEHAQAGAADGLFHTGPLPVVAAKAKRSANRTRNIALAALAVAVAGVVAFFGLQWLWQPHLSDTELALVVGSNVQVELQNAVGDVEWRAGDKGVLGLEADGAKVVVTAKGKGAVKLVAFNGGHQYECAVTVDKPQLNKTSLALRQGEYYIMELKGTEAQTEWTSSDPDTVEVSVVEGTKATIAAKKAGKATIRAEVAGVVYACMVTVTAASGAGSSARPARSGGNDVGFMTATVSSDDGDEGADGTGSGDNTDDTDGNTDDGTHVDTGDGSSDGNAGQDEDGTSQPSTSRSSTSDDGSTSTAQSTSSTASSGSNTSDSAETSSSDSE